MSILQIYLIPEDDDPFAFIATEVMGTVVVGHSHPRTIKTKAA